MARRSEIEALLNSERENVRGELKSQLETSQQTFRIDELRRPVPGLLEFPTQEKPAMQQTAENSHQTLPAAAQQQNAAQDRVAYIEGRHEIEAALLQAGKGIRNAQSSLDKAYENATPAERKELEKMEYPLHSAQGDIQQSLGISMGVSKTNNDNKLSKDGKSQFNGAAKGDPRSIEPQVEKQFEQVKQQNKRTISASPEWANDTPLERQRGEAKQQFTKSHDAKPEPEQSRQIESQQVKDSKAEPHLKPSPELGGGVDAQVHNDAKTKDHQASLQATKQSQAAKEAAKPDITPEMQQHYAKLSQQLDTMQAGQGQSQGMSQSGGMKP